MVGKNNGPYLQMLAFEARRLVSLDLNSSLTRPFAMARFLDGEDVRQVEFEAEMQGYSELLRRTRGSLRRSFNLPVSPCPSAIF